MSATQEFHESGQEIVEAGPAEVVASTVKEVETLLGATNDSLQALCRRIEEATTRDGVLLAFRPFNRTMRIFMEMVSDETYDHLARQAVCDLGVSQRFEDALTAAASFREALTFYKTAVVRDLSSALQRAREQASMDDELDEDLLSQFLPGPTVPQNEGVKRSAPKVGTKRVFSAVEQAEGMTRIPKKKCTIPALASISRSLAVLSLASPRRSTF